MSKLDEAFQVTEIDDQVEHVRNSVSINGGDLRRDLERLPADLAHYGFEFARAHRRMLAAKLRHDEVRSAVYLQTREDLEDNVNGKRVTEATIEGNVVAHASVHAAKAAVIETEYEREQLRAVCDALRAKRESLMSLVTLARAELAGTHGFREPPATDGDANG